MPVPVYDNADFFEGYAQLPRSQTGLDGAPEWASLELLLPDLSEGQVIDLGCGYGWFCRKSREKGAKNVLGLDVSVRMLERARGMTKDESIQYERTDLEELRLSENIVDLVYSSLALHYIVNLSGVFREVYKSLRSGAAFVFSMEHPIFTAAVHAQWIIEADGTRSWPVNQYQMEGERSRDWIIKGVIKQHRTMGTILNSLIEHGFVLAHVEEWDPSEKQIADMPGLAIERERPMFLIIKALKP